ncbi:adenylate/guanylate cyclase domain-containing protein [Natronospirillum operosum]|uniref:Adenylate/guanylate cyclase domain-containing protein n=1 Tax=Natronospirillum operosum TaxID=2759953 RepID=A0A4Z0WIW9_9GAMM|nr:adenylate/guanylate cyclase domain-containing protein [Natronospirillum operosum]TGG95095.1 adenylate/guanylate cyclase domain-containing protein [Natronospirillum operosum]
MQASPTTLRRWMRRGLSIARSSWGILLSLAVTVLLAGEEMRRNIPTYDSQVLERLDYLYYDTRMRMLPMPAVADEPPIVIIDIDEQSLAEQGRWPWSRLVMTALNDRLLDAGVYTITYDVVFSEPERNIALEMAELLDDELISGLVAGLQDDVDYDSLFAESLRDAGAVLGYSFYPDDRTAVGSLPSPLAPVQDPGLDDQAQTPLTTVRARGHVGNLPALQEAAESGGLINPVPDLDGVIRRVALLQEYEEHLYTSLALATVYNYFLYAPDEVNFRIAEEGPRRVFRSVDVAAEGGPNRINTDAFSRVLVPYVGGQKTFPYVSATDVIEGRLSEDEQALLDGAIVLVGTSSIGLLDLRATPLDNAYPGVEIHANLVNGLITGNIGHQLHDTHLYTALLMLVLGILFSFWFRRFGPLPLLGMTLGCLVVVAGLNYWAWTVHWANVPVAAVLLLIVFLGAFNMLEGFLRERASRQEVHSMFGQYVPAEHIDRMLQAGDDDFGFQGENRELTVLFSDIRSFTSISEQLSATELKDLLNRYFTPITRLIFERRGTIDKYVGDMVMAFWGAPLENPQHAQDALDAAMDMIDRVNALKPEFRADGLPEITVGIGLNTGHMNVGDMGSEYRKAYTVLGDAVNLGSRLESLTKFYGVDVLISESTRNQCQGYAFRFIDLIVVKGKTEPVRTYQPVCRESEVTPDLRAELEAYEQAWALYRQRDWPAASTAFAALLQNAPPARAKLYSVYLERIEELRTQTLDDDWDGAHRHTTK